MSNEAVYRTAPATPGLLMKWNTLFFKGTVFQGQKDIFQNWLQAAPLCQLNQTYRFIMLDQKG